MPIDPDWWLVIQKNCYTGISIFLDSEAKGRGFDPRQPHHQRGNRKFRAPMSKNFEWCPIVKKQFGPNKTDRRRRSAQFSMAQLWPTHGPCLARGIFHGADFDYWPHGPFFYLRCRIPDSQYSLGWIPWFYGTLLADALALKKCLKP